MIATGAQRVRDPVVQRVRVTFDNKAMACPAASDNPVLCLFGRKSAIYVCADTDHDTFAKIRFHRYDIRENSDRNPSNELSFFGASDTPTRRSANAATPLPKVVPAPSGLPSIRAL